MKKPLFYPFAAALLLLTLAFASCSSPFFGSAKSAKVSLRLNLPDKPESHIPEGILRDLAEMTIHNSPGSRLIHPEGNWLKLEIRQGSKILYSIAKGIEPNKSELQIDPIILPVKTKLNLKVRFYEKTGQSNEILLGSSDSELYLEDKEFSEILVGIKPVTAISGEVGDWINNANSIDFNVSEYSDDFFILEFPVDFGDGLYKIEWDPAPAGNFDSVILYTADGIRHKGTIFGDKLEITPELGQSPEKELYFGLKGTENQCYVLLQDSEYFGNSNISIHLTKLEEELLVVGQSNFYYADKYILQKSVNSPQTIEFGEVYSGTNHLLEFYIYNPYNQSLPLSISLKDKDTGAPYQSDRFSIDIPENQDAILPGKVLGLDAYLHFITGGADPEDEPKCVITSPGFADFAMIFKGSQC